MSTTIIHLQGKTEEALSFYEDVFDCKRNRVIYYKDLPPNIGFDVPDAMLNQILRGEISFKNSNFILSDVPLPTKGSNVQIGLGCETEEEIKNLFDKLSYKGNVLMPLNKIFFAKLYCQIEDRFGIIWHFSLE